MFLFIDAGASPGGGRGGGVCGEALRGVEGCASGPLPITVTYTLRMYRVWLTGRRVGVTALYMAERHKECPSCVTEDSRRWRQVCPAWNVW